MYCKQLVLAHFFQVKFQSYELNECDFFILLIYLCPWASCVRLGLLLAAPTLTNVQQTNICPLNCHSLWQVLIQSTLIGSRRTVGFWVFAAILWNICIFHLRSQKLITKCARERPYYGHVIEVTYTELNVVRVNLFLPMAEIHISLRRS